MSESPVRAERFSAPSSSSPSYLWEVPNKPVSVQINLETVDRLEREVVESFRSLSSRGSEIGGILLGSSQSGSPARVTIESYELVTCDYVRGPLYQFSEADSERFEHAVQQHASGGLRVVGFFRSHTRKGLGLDAEDTAFLSGHFRDPHQVALLIRPYASKASTAGLFIWENGIIRAEASYQEFPFRRSELERMPKSESKPHSDKAESGIPSGSLTTEPAASKPAVRAQIVPIASRREVAMPPSAVVERPSTRNEVPVPEAPPRAAEKPEPSEPAVPSSAFTKPVTPNYSRPAPPVEEKAPETMPLADLVLPPLERPKGKKTVWIAAGSAVALLLLSGALIYPGLGRKGKRAPAIPGAAALALHVERNAGELVLNWNRDSDAIKGAAHATLAISDGEQHENVSLDMAQLRNGSIVYSPTSADVSFQLSIVGQDASQTQSESVRILRTRPSPMQDTPPVVPAKSTNATTRGESNAAPSPNAPPPSAPAESAPVAENHAKPTGSALKEFHAESLSQRLRPTRAQDLPEAPGLLAAAGPAPVSLPGLNSMPGAPLPPPPSGGSAGSKSGGQIQSAQLVSSKPPEYPLVAKNAHVQGVVVVAATVGVDGKVKSANAVSGPPLLQKAAVDAVKQWVYRPTTLNGAPVESETRVEVKFTTGR